MSKVISLGKANTQEVVNEKVKLPNYLDICEYKYTEIEGKIKTLLAEKEELKQKILAKFEEDFGHEGHSVISTITGNTIQRVLNIYQDVDEKKLKKLVSSTIWKRITVDKVSMELFTSLIKAGEIKASKVAEATSSKEVEKLVIRKKK